jgi:outer membrane protein TolC
MVGEVVPVDVPVREWLPADAQVMSMTAIQRLPELAQLRKQLEIRSMQLYVAEKDRLPDVNMLGEYRTSGLASNMTDALDQSGSLGFPTWTLGLTFEYPLGNKTARSRSRAAELELTRDQLILKTSEDRASYNISKLIAFLEAAWERHESASRQVKQSEEWLRLSGIRYKNPLPTSRGGNWLLLALVDYQNAMRGYVSAVTAASETLSEYNVALARLDEAQGISMERWAVELDGQPNPTGPEAAATSGAAFAAARQESKPEASNLEARRPVEQASFNSRAPEPPRPANWQGHSSYRYQYQRPAQARPR